MGKKPYRHSPIREIKPRFLVVTEGETEENYFRAIKKFFRGLPIEIIPKKGKNSNPMAVFKTAKREIVASRDNQYTAAYVVVDRETQNADLKSLSTALAESVKPVAKRDIKCDIIISNPSFEYWILSHFDYTMKIFTNSDAVIVELKRHIKDYKKAYDFLSKVNDENKDYLSGILDSAVDNARRCEQSHGVNFNPTTSNPSTQVYRIIERIKSMSGM